MLAITKVLLEAPIHPNALAMMKETPNWKEAEAANAAVKTGGTRGLVQDQGGEVRQQAAAGPTVINKVGATNVDAATLGAKAAAKTTAIENPAKHELMKKTFNALPNKGKDLHIAGKGQTGNINPEHQKQFDTMYKKIAGEQTPGVPGKVVQKAVKAVGPAHQDITAGQAAGVLVKKGAHAVGDAVSATGNAVASGAKGIAQHLGEHPLAAAGTLAVGAAGALGLRNMLRRNRPATA
jgi:hypothetical protein